ncbi:MAG: glycoside hydrolase family 88 protein [Bacteroidota bacterium]
MIHRFSILIATCLVWCLPPHSTAQDSSLTREKLTTVADAVLNNATFKFVDQKSGRRFLSPLDAPADAELRLESRYNDWRYWNGVLNIAMIQLGDALHRRDYVEFALKNVALSFNHYRFFKDRDKGEGKWNYPFGQRFTMEELDDYGAMGASVIDVYLRDQQERYRTYVVRAGAFLLSQQHRLQDGTLVRSFPRQWTLWADDLYMSVSLLARLGTLSGDKQYWEDAALQIRNFHEKLFSPEKGLMYHCWFSEGSRQGVAFWGRANGWALLAQADLLDHLPPDHPLRPALLDLFRRHLLGVARYQGADGLWHQLLDKPDSYEETSCSAMFTYAFARAVNRGYLDPQYASIARRGWEGVLSKIHADGQIESVCTGTVVSDDLVSYYRRPAPLNDVHGIGAVLLVGAEMLSLERQPGK